MPAVRGGGVMTTACRVCRQGYRPAAVGVDEVCDRCAESAVRRIEALCGQAGVGLPEKWFHVSPHRLGPGTVLTAGAARNPANDCFYGSGFGGDSGVLRDMGVRRDEVVWLSPTREDAAFWAVVLNARHCYEVQPIEEPQPWNGTGTDGWVVRKAIVVCTVEYA